MASNWDPAGSQPPNVGTTGDGEVISFKDGSREGENLLSAGDYSKDSKGFDANHDHAYPGGYEDKGAMENGVNAEDLTDD